MIWLLPRKCSWINIKTQIYFDKIISRKITETYAPFNSTLGGDSPDRVHSFSDWPRDLSFFVLLLFVQLLPLTWAFLPSLLSSMELLLRVLNMLRFSEFLWIPFYFFWPYYCIVYWKSGYLLFCFWSSCCLFVFLNSPSPLLPTQR